MDVFYDFKNIVCIIVSLDYVEDPQLCQISDRLPGQVSKFGSKENAVASYPSHR